jgi:glycosyltransferase involved in cell wall biosynthesis
MRVLHAYNQHRGGGGADNATRSIIEVSSRRGIEVEVFTRNSESLGRGLSGRLAAGFSAIYSPSSVAAFRQLLDSFRPDIVHAHEVFPFVTPWIVPEAARRRIPVVLSTVDYRITCPIVTHLRDGKVCTLCVGGNEHQALLHNCRGDLKESAVVTAYNTMVSRLGLFRRNVAVVVTPSEFTRRWLIKYGSFPEERVVAIPMFVEIPPTAADPALGTYVGFSGRLDPEKGVDILSEAARISGLPCKVSRNAASLIRIDVPANLEVEVTHFRQELFDFYRGARILAVPSRALETFGLVVAEALSHGIPVVASDLGPLPELVEHGVNGLVFPPNDAPALARALRTLWDDPEACCRMGAAGRQKAAAVWTADAHFQKLSSIYQRVLERRARTEAA